MNKVPGTRHSRDLFVNMQQTMFITNRNPLFHSKENFLALVFVYSIFRNFSLKFLHPGPNLWSRVELSWVLLLGMGWSVHWSLSMCGQLFPLSFSWNKNTYRWPTIQSGALGVELERVLLCFIDSDPVYTFHNKYKNIFLIHSNEIFLFDGIHGGIFRNQNFSSYRQNDGFTTKRKNINFP